MPILDVQINACSHSHTNKAYNHLVHKSDRKGSKDVISQWVSPCSVCPWVAVGLEDTPPEEGQGGQQAQQGLACSREGGRVAQVRAAAPVCEAGHRGEHLGEPVVVAVRILDALAVDVATWRTERIE